jgi:tetratricopeptide (TPR) repeat protein
MRARRYRRLIDADRNQQRTAPAAPTGEVMGWLREHIVGSIIGAALIATATAWLQGAFDSVLRDTLPSGTDAFCALSETVKYHWPFSTPPASSNRFSVLLATIDRDDAEHTYTRAVKRAFLKREDIEPIATCRVLRLSDVGRDAEASAVATAREWLDQRQADLLIAGEMLKKDDAVSLWFIDKDPTHDWRASTFRLDANLLKQDFSEAASTQLLAIALSTIKPAAKENGQYGVTVLKPIAERLQHLLDFAGEFTAPQRADLELALGITLFVIGDQSGENDALADAVAAYKSALEKTTRNLVPLQWAVVQTNLGTALEKLGEREIGTGRLAEAVTAYHAALDEMTRDRVPLQWAMVQSNLSVALEKLGGRESGTGRLAEAVAASSAALEETTRDRMPLQWAMTQNNLGQALVPLGVRENNAARLEEAVAAYRAALEEITRDRVPLHWASVQNNLGQALVALGRQEGDTAQVEEGVAAYRVALEETKRDRVPLQWAMVQSNLGFALQMLGLRENDTARLEEAAAAYRAALGEMTRDRAPSQWALIQYFLGLALEKIGEQEIGTGRLEEAVAVWEACLTVAPSTWPPARVQEVGSHIDQARAEIARRTAQ